MGPPGGSRNEITSRLTRHFNLIGIDSFTDAIYETIFATITDWHFDERYPSSCQLLGRQIVSATLKLFNTILPKFLPIPSKSHYLFNLRDFSRVIAGILLIKPAQLPESTVLIKLWLHEVYRVFYDRLTDADDRKMFFAMCKDNLHSYFKTDINKLLGHLAPGRDIVDDDVRKLMFGNYMSGGKYYDEVVDLKKLRKIIENYVDEYNLSSHTPMKFVPFTYAIEHVSKVSRVLQQANGHILLAGVGGSGRQTVAKLATYIAEFSMYQVEIGKNYGTTEWRNDLRSLLFRAGAEGKKTTFLINDNQIAVESMLEDINMLLNGADIPNLYPSDEKAQVGH